MVALWLPLGGSWILRSKRLRERKEKTLKYFSKIFKELPLPTPTNPSSTTWAHTFFSSNFPFHRPAHAPFFTKLRFQKYAQGKLFSSFSKIFFAPNPRFSPFSKLFPVQMQTASYLFTAKKREKRTTCTTETPERSPSFG